MALAMPFKTIRADVTSGIFSLAGDWVRGGYDVDPLASKYDEGNFVFSKSRGSTISFNFTGYEVEMIGAYRYNDGRYQVYLDDIPRGPFRTSSETAPTKASENSSSTEIFQQKLFSWSGEEGFHTVRLENLSISNQTNPASGDLLNRVDLDHVFWRYTVAGIEDLTVRNDGARFSYSDSWNWVQTVPNFPNFTSSSAHVTTLDGAFVDIAFNGDRIAVYGGTGKSVPAYVATIDGVDQGLLNVASNLDSPFNNLGNQLLYITSGLDADHPHNLRLTAKMNESLPFSTSQSFAIDYAVVDFERNQDILFTYAGLSTDAKVAIGIGVGGASLLLLCIIGYIFAFYAYSHHREEYPSYAPNKHMILAHHSHKPPGSMMPAFIPDHYYSTSPSGRKKIPLPPGLMPSNYVDLLPLDYSKSPSRDG